MLDAICSSIEKLGPVDPANYRDRRAIALAALCAVRDAEPTEAMMSAIWSMRVANSKESFTECYRSMLDAAIQEAE